jgi:hypothetical protein
MTSDLDRELAEEQQRAKDKAIEREERLTRALENISSSLEDISERLGTMTVILSEINDGGFRR